MTLGRFERFKPRGYLRAGFGLSCALWLGSVAQACGSDDAPKPSGTGGSAAGAGGSSPDAGKPTDSTAPQFAGVVSAQATAETRVLLSWAAATDNVTPAPRIAYQIYTSTTSGNFDFSTPRVVAPSGATSAVVSDLTPNTEHFFVVRAVDEA